MRFKDFYIKYKEIELEECIKNHNKSKLFYVIDIFID